MLIPPPLFKSHTKTFLAFSNFLLPNSFHHLIYGSFPKFEDVKKFQEERTRKWLLFFLSFLPSFPLSRGTRKIIEPVGSCERGGRHTRGMRRGSAASDAYIKRGERGLANPDSSGYSNSEIHETSPGRCSTGDGGDLHSKGKFKTRSKRVQMYKFAG